MGDSTRDSSAKRNEKEVFPSSFSDKVGYASTFNQDISGWDVSMVNEMNSMFRNALEFNQGIAASAFNRDIAGWSESQVTDMSAMFRNAYAFNHHIAGLDVAGVTDGWDVRGVSPRTEPEICRKFEDLLVQEKQVVSKFDKTTKSDSPNLKRLTDTNQRN